MDSAQYRDVPLASLVVSASLTVSYLSFLYTQSDNTFAIPFLAAVALLVVFQLVYSPRSDEDRSNVRTFLTAILIYCVVPLGTAVAMLFVLPLALGILTVLAALPLSTVATIAAGIRHAWPGFLTHWILFYSPIYGFMAGAVAVLLRIVVQAVRTFGPRLPDS